MYSIRVSDFDDWRTKARKFLLASTPPEEIQFHDLSAQSLLFTSEDLPNGIDLKLSADVPIVPRQFLDLAKIIVHHSDPDRFQLLYRLLWRVTQGEPYLLEMTTDDDVHRVRAMGKAVERDAHKMQAFVRFRRVESSGREQFIAWHRPDHRIVRFVAPFFARRFSSMDWTIFTPDESVTWDCQELIYGPGIPQCEAPQSDELENLWRTYYGSIFNPARIKLKAMRAEMPVRHWKTLPETAIIDELLAEAPHRVKEMIARQEGYAHTAADFFPQMMNWHDFSQSIINCQACDLYNAATQAVFGEGPLTAPLMLIGEQPGDVEDREGRPFVGPAGKILSDAMQQAELDRSDVYLTNAVKHFKHEIRGPRRLHQTPKAREVSACRPWVEMEIAFVRPDVLICLGATAAHALIGRDFNLTRSRGQFISTHWCENTLATYHPSAVLRDPNEKHASEVMASLVADLKIAKTRLPNSSQ